MSEEATEAPIEESTTQARSESVSYDERTIESTESITDAIQRPVPQNYIKGITAIMASMGVLLGIGVFLVASFGGRSLLPGIVQQFAGTPGLNEGLAVTHELTIAYMANELAIFLSFLMAPVFGLLVAFKLDDTPQAKMGAAGVGLALGTIAFTFVVVAVASFVAPTAADLFAIETAIDPEAQAAAGPEAELLEGTDLGSMDFTNTLLNSVLIGVPAGLAAAAVVYFDDRFFE